MIVMKFGGTSNEDATAMANVVRIVKSRAGESPIVVISAIARATNELEQVARLAATGDAGAAANCASKLLDRHLTIVRDLIHSSELASHLESALSTHLRQIRELVNGIAILRELTPRSMDAICSHGERMSSRIIAAALEESGQEAVWVDAREFMITDDHFGAARPLMETVVERLESCVLPLLNTGRIPVTQGFIGFTPSGAYTTMGRESSDYSASIIGAAMKADMVQIWTDVDGILTADPRVVPDAQRISCISFQEAFELSYFGAKVLHPATMLPVIEKEIPVTILNSKNDHSMGTLINTKGDSTTGAKAIASRSDLTIVIMSPRKKFNQYFFWEGVLGILNKFSVPVSITASSGSQLVFIADRTAITDMVISALEEIGTTRIQNGMASVSLVGSGLGQDKTLTERTCAALKGVEVGMISTASDSSMTVVVDGPSVERAVRLLHAQFFAPAGIDSHQ